MFARKASIEYHSPAHFDDVIEVGVRCAFLGRSSVRFALEIYRGEEYLVAGELLYVYADTVARKGVAVPEEWRAILTRFEKTAPATS